MLEENLWYRILRIILFALLLTPLGIWSIFLFPFITTKILYFRLLVEFALLLYLILALKYPEIRPSWNALTLAVWLYAGVIILTSIFGVNFNKSFWGTVERGEGIITILHFVAYFTILPAVFRQRKDWYRYLNVALLVTLIVALIGLVQLSCQEVTGLSREGVCGFVPPTQGARISSTIGNASFFAAFLLFGVFLAFYLWRQAPAVWQRWYLRAVFIFELIILYNSQTRGAVLAVVLTFLLFFIYQLVASPKRRVRIVSLALLILLLGFGISVYLQRNASWVQDNSTLRRLATISTADITTQSRFDTWNASWKGWQDRLILGYGYENYNIAFNKYFPARIFKDQGSQIWFDRAHNVTLDVAVASGLLGSVGYLAIFAVAFWYLFKLSRQSGFDQTSAVILALLLLGYFLQNLFVFDTQATYLMAFLLFAHITFLYQQRSGSPVVPEQGPKKNSRAATLLTIGFTILTLLLAYLVNIEPAFANYHTTQAIKATKLKQYRVVKQIFEQALSYGTYMDEEIRQRLVDYTTEVVTSGQLSPREQNELYQYSTAEMKKNINRSPLDVKNYLYLMNVLNRQSSDQRNLDEAISLGQEALKLSPTRPQIYFELGQAYFSKEDYVKGLEQFRKAIELNPEPKESQFNYLLASIIAGEEEITKRQLKIINEDIGYKFTVADYLAIARAYLEAKDMPRAIENYAKAVALNPDNADLRAKLAAAYGEVCDVTNATVHVNEAVRLNQSFTLEAEEFLRRLEEKCKK